MNKRLATRQIHLDFHTSEFLKDVGKDFDKANFQDALKKGHVNSVTVFAKCHHGYCYYPTEVGTMHPGMEPDFDLTKAMMDACHEIGVNAPIYLTLGWSVLDEQTHPEWRCKNPDGSYQTWNYDLEAKPDEEKPECSWLHLCPAGDYQKHLFDLTDEVCERYDRVDGLFFDIVFMSEICYCDSCVAGMKKMGLDPTKEEDAKAYYTIKRKETMDGLRKRLFAKHPHATIFFNTGGAEMEMPQWHYANTHFELEDLPTTWGGYDKMPIRAKYFSRKGKDYLGMTGKFHRAWGEFGGFKSPEAMTYECAALMTYGARISIGDQLHPCGKMDPETYRLIGEAYSYVESIEDFCYDTEETANLGVLISESKDINEGVAKLLLDSGYDFDIVHTPKDFDRFEAVVLTDETTVDEEWASSLSDYINKGGHVLAMGNGGLNKEKTAFAVEMGIGYKGKSSYDIDYIVAGDALSKDIVKAPFLCYETANMVEVNDAKVLAGLREPYFSRTYKHYTSHLNTPYVLEDADYPSATRKGNVVYLAHKVGKLYKEFGATFHRKYFKNALELIYSTPRVKATLPTAGRIHLVDQKHEDRYIMHLLYGAPMQRGVASIIEDVPTLTDTKVEIAAEKPIKKVTLVPQMIEIPFEQEGNTVSATLPKFSLHQIIAFDYK